MSERVELSPFLSTSCFTMGYLKEVSYYIFQYKELQSASLGNTIYEVESSIRKEYPSAIMFVYTKEIYLYDLNCESDLPSAHDRFNKILSSKNLELELLSKGSFHSKTIFNNNQQGPQNKSLPLVYINFLKAIKRYIIWKLADQKQSNGLLKIIGFGNHSISLRSSSNSCYLVSIDPIYNFNDEIMINVCTKDQDLEKITEDTGNFMSNDYALYLAPSAVRVYLAGEDLVTSLVNVDPQKQTKLLMLLRNYCNLDLFLIKELRWIKVIPNLNHLNHLTPSIASYLKGLNSGLKYIIWPLALCFIQKGLQDNAVINFEEMEEKADCFGHVFDIIDEFVEYNNEVELMKRKEAESISAIHTPASFTIGTPGAIQDFTENGFGTTRLNIQQTQESPGQDNNTIYENLKEDEDIDMDDKWDTELFGNDDEDDEKDEITNEKIADDDDLDFFADSLIDNEIDRYFSDSEVELDLTRDKELDLDREKHEKMGLDNNGEDAANISFIDTSKFIKAAGTDNSLYEDPGAPEPVPFAIIAENSLKDQKIIESDKKKSVFAPLNFNPAIEQSIDSKYLNGGKFYVPPDGDADSITAETIDTSIKSFISVTPSLRKGTFESTTVVSSSEDSGSSDEDVMVDEDEDMDDDEDDDGENGPEIAEDYDWGANSELKHMKQTGLGIIHLKKDELIMDEDKMNNLAMSSPFKKNEISFTPPFNAPSNSSPSISDSSPLTPNNSTTSSENQNWLPFLLKLIPLYTLPNAFLHSNPTVTKEELNDVLPLILKIFVFDAFNDNNSCTNNFETGNLEMLKFKKAMINPCDLELCFLIENCFNGIKKTSLHDLLKQDSDNDMSMRESFECLTGYGMKEKYEFDMTNKIEFSDPTFPSNSPLTNLGQGMVAIESSSQSEITKNMFEIPQPIISLNRLDQELQLTFSSLGFWNLLNLQPFGASKDFDMVTILPRFGKCACGDDSYFSKAVEFSASLRRDYSSSRLGVANKIDKELSNDRTMQDGVALTTRLSEGVFEILCKSDLDESSIWKIVGEEILLLVEVIKSLKDDEMTRPVLLLFVNPIGSFRSFVEIGKILAKFNNGLKTNTTTENIDVDSSGGKKKRKMTTPKTTVKPTSCLQTFTKIVALDTFYSPEQTYTIVSDATFNKLSLGLYNLCPTANMNPESLFDSPFTTLSPPLPDRINYKLTKASIAKSVNSRDLYIHMAYERSIDKNWCVASWSDQYGRISNVKCWYCPPPPFGSKDPSLFKSFEEISNEIWNITLSYIRSHSGKSYLVLTRLNNIIPDDELIHWRRLSLKTKNLLLIVLAVSLNSNLILNSFDDALSNSSANHLHHHQSNGKRVKNDVDSVPATTSNTGLTPFLVGNGDSPEAYMTGGGGVGGSGGGGGGAGNGGTPVEMSSPSTMITTTTVQQLGKLFNNTEDVSIVDISNGSYGIILPNPIPLTNQQNRISIKTGYLIKTSIQNDKFVQLLGTKDDSATPTPHVQQQQQQQQKHTQPPLQQHLHLPHHHPHVQQQQQQQTRQQQQFRHTIKSANALEINLMSCPNFINGSELVRELLLQYRGLSSLGECWGMNETNNLHMSEGDELMIPWHILSVRKCLNALVHIRVITD